MQRQSASASHSTAMLTPQRSSSNISTQRSSLYGKTEATVEHCDPTSSNESLGQDDENVTITSNRQLQPSTSDRGSQENLHQLAISTNMIELSYSISEIQTRIFEIQELRHRSQSPEDTLKTTNTIDKALMALDEQLEYIAKSMKTLSDKIQALTTSSNNTLTPESLVLKKRYLAISSDWESVQDESDVLREELKEDKWLTVFRTVTEQADGMMSSLEKAVNRCQDFIWQVHRQAPDSLSASQADSASLNLETYHTLLESFEAKKKHYTPATSKVLAIIDKGVQDRVTKNGETLRRHAESSKRWRNLRDRIGRTDVEMAAVHKILLNLDKNYDESSSSTNISAVSTKNGYLTPPSAVNGGAASYRSVPSEARSSSRAASASSSVSRSLSPLRNFARRIVGKSPNSSSGLKSSAKSPTAASTSFAPSKNAKRSSIFSIGSSQPKTPERPTHGHSHSLMPEWSPQSTTMKTEDKNPTIRPKSVIKQRWNSSTKVEPALDHLELGTVRHNHPPSLRRPSVSGVYDDIPPVPPIAAQYRSASRSSMGSSRPWTPVTSSGSTAPTSHLSSTASNVQPSQASTHIPARSYTPTTPRVPKTPSHIPVPKRPSSPMSDMGWDDCDIQPRNLGSGAFSPELVNDHGVNADGLPITRSQFTGMEALTPNSVMRQVHPRPPSRTMIPAYTPTRPRSSMSHARPESRLANPRGSYMRAQTPESSMIARTRLLPFFTGGGSPRGVARPSIAKMPPSSYRETSTSRTPSRPSSRAGAATPAFDRDNLLQFFYTPAGNKDPLDNEVAAIVNGMSHGLLIERVDPPLRAPPKAGVEVHGQYAFSNSLARKIVTCRLTTMTRSGVKMEGKTVTTKKVMVRVGGGWQDLHIYMLNRQAGM